MKKNDWKDRLNIVYSTNPDFRYKQEGEDEAETLDKNKQPLRVNIEKKGRGGKTVTVIKGFIGKTVTVIKGFIGTEDDLKELGKLLKTKCSTGGSVKEGEILIQGDFKQRLVEILRNEGYTQAK